MLFMYADAPPPAVFVVSETAGFHHDSIPAEQAFLRSLRGLRVTVVDRIAELTPDALRGARAVVFASTSGSPPRNPAVLRFVRDGGGFVGLHSASDTYADWPAFVRMLGGVRFTGHGPVEPRRLTTTRDTVTRGLPRTFGQTDEYYRFKGAPKAKVVVRLGRAPLVWRRREGRGRVFFSALGHPIGAWSAPRHRRLVTQGLRWAIGAAPTP
jgi:type 1 glutamine amidotransferase